MTSRRIPSRLRLRLLLTVAVLTIAGAVWGVSQTQRSVADRAFTENRAAQQMLTAMLDQETGLRGFALSGRESFLEPFDSGVRAFDAAAAEARALTGPTAASGVEMQVDAARRWQSLARQEIARLRDRGKGPLTVRFVQIRKNAFDRFRSFNRTFQAQLEADRDSSARRAGLISTATILVLGLLFGGVGYLGIERSSRAARIRRARERDYRVTQAEFNQTMQVMRDEDEAHSLVKRHLERSIPESRVVVLTRNNSADRLTAATPVPEGSPVAQRLADASPHSCLSVRLAREYRRSEDASPLLSCDICGKLAGDVTCVPSLVSGEVIGSVLVGTARRAL